MKYLIVLLLCFSFNGFSQNNTQIKGVIYSSDSTEVIPFAKLWLTTKTDTVVTHTDIKGNYIFKNLKTDTFDLRVESLSMERRVIKQITLKSNESLCLNVFSSIQLICNGCCQMICLRRPRAYEIGNENHVKLTRVDIQRTGTIRISDGVVKMSTDFNQQENQLFVRGSRENNVMYYVDGVRQSKVPKLPRVAINSMSFYLGGVPAKFGDTTSGIVVVETKSYFGLYYAWRAKQ